MSTNNQTEKEKQDAIERRQDLATKVAVLEERSVNNREKFNKFENVFLVHAKHEEIVMTEIVEKLESVHDDVTEQVNKLIAPVEIKVESHEKELTRFKTITGTFVLVISGLFAILEYFKDPIIKWLSK